jgi:hypothetical protein
MKVLSRCSWKAATSWQWGQIKLDPW